MQHVNVMHIAVMERFLDIMAHHDAQPVLRDLWLKANVQMQSCADCVGAYHDGQVHS